jgi:hypothetical protein
MAGNGKRQPTSRSLVRRTTSKCSRKVADSKRRILTTGDVSVTVSTGENDLDIIIHSNGPGLQEAIADMINRKAWDK